MARVTRIAVNLSLIIAVTMQPTFAYGFGQDCTAVGASGFTCQGCGCCKVVSENAKCPCCSGKPSNEHERDGCCGHGHDRLRQQPAVVTIDEVDPFAGMVLEEGPVFERNEGSDQPAEEDTQPAVKTAALKLKSACNCVSCPEPQKAPVPRSPVTELRDDLSLNIPIFGLIGQADKPPLYSSPDDSHPAVAPHFSQISFCVWRL